MRGFVNRILIVVIVVSVLIVFSEDAQAASCAPRATTSIEQAFIGADIVFKGTVTKISEPETGHNPLIDASRGIKRVVFNVTELYKAPEEFSGDTIRIVLNSIVFFPNEVEPGKEFIIYAWKFRKDKEKDLWWASSGFCGRTFYHSLEQRLHDIKAARQTDNDENRFQGLAFTGKLIKSAHHIQGKDDEVWLSTASELDFKIEKLFYKDLSLSSYTPLPWATQPEEFKGDIKEGDMVRIQTRNCDQGFDLAGQYFIQAHRNERITIENDGTASGFAFKCHGAERLRYHANANEEAILRRLGQRLQQQKQTTTE